MFNTFRTRNITASRVCCLIQFLRPRNNTYGASQLLHIAQQHDITLLLLTLCNIPSSQQKRRTHALQQQRHCSLCIVSSGCQQNVIIGPRAFTPIIQPFAFPCVNQFFTPKCLHETNTPLALFGLITSQPVP